eukprot:7498764-Pyramimonas_sp.AAC.1
MRFLVAAGAFVGAVVPGRVAPAVRRRIARRAVPAGAQLLRVVPLLLAPHVINRVDGVLRPREAHLALALALDMVARPGLRPHRRVGSFTGLTLALVADVYATVLEDQNVLDVSKVVAFPADVNAIRFSEGERPA